MQATITKNKTINCIVKRSPPFQGGERLTAEGGQKLKILYPQTK